MDYAALKGELSARGFNDLDDQRLGQFINQAYQEICDDEWTFLETVTTGVVPVVIADLRDVITVTGPLRELEGRDVGFITDLNPPMDQAGSASLWWRDDTSGTPEIRVWPLDTSSFTVRYHREPAPLKRSEDLPVFPERYHLLIVDAAKAAALRDKSNYADADEVVAGMQAALQRMRDALLDPIAMVQRLTDPCSC